MLVFKFDILLAVEKRDKAGIVYNGTTAWTKDTIYLKVNVASVQITIFIY